MTATEQQLRERIQDLEDEVRGLQALLVGGDHWWSVFNLTGMEGKIFGLLMRRQSATRDQLLDVLYSGERNFEAEPNIVNVFLVRVRSKIGKHGIVIKTVWGRGWLIDAENKAKVNALVSPSQAAAS